jgi:hypothetical protein
VDDADGARRAARVSEGGAGAPAHLSQPSPKRLWDLSLERRDAIGHAYHVLTFAAREPILALPG